MSSLLWLMFAFRSSSALGSLLGFMPMACRNSLEVMISLRVNLSAISATAETGVSLNGSRKYITDSRFARSSSVRNFRRISSTAAATMGSMVRFS